MLLLRPAATRSALALLVLLLSAARPCSAQRGPGHAASGDAAPPTTAGVPVVDLDLLPGDPDNTIVIGSDEGIALAILSRDGFDAAELDPATLDLSRAAVLRGPRERPLAVVMDVDQDGRPDLVAQFAQRAVRADEQGVVVLHGRVRAGGEVVGYAQGRWVTEEAIEGGGTAQGGDVGGGTVDGIDLARARFARAGGMPAFTVGPNPTRAGVTVTFARPASGSAIVELLDVAGRRLERVEVGAGPGVSRLMLLAGGRPEPGRYFVRLRQGTRISTRAVTVLR